MAVQQQDLAAARTAALELGRTVGALRRHYGDSVDLQRLVVDTERIATDLDLLAGPPATTQTQTAQQRVLEIIPDEDYPAEFWLDAEHEGLGPR